MATACKLTPSDASTMPTTALLSSVFAAVRPAVVVDTHSRVALCHYCALHKHKKKIGYVIN